MGNVRMGSVRVEVVGEYSQLLLLSVLDLLAENIALMMNVGYNNFKSSFLFTVAVCFRYH